MVNKNKPITRHRQEGETRWHYLIYELGLEEVVNDPVVGKLGQIVEYIDLYLDEDCEPKGPLKDEEYFVPMLHDAIREMLKKIRDGQLNTHIYNFFSRNSADEILEKSMKHLKTNPRCIYHQLECLASPERSKKLLDSLPKEVRERFDCYVSRYCRGQLPK